MANRGRYTPVETLQRIAELARLKKSQGEIASQCGVSRPTVRKYFPPDVDPLPAHRPPKPPAACLGLM